MARPARFERATAWFVARYSIQLSYGRVTDVNQQVFADLTNQVGKWRRERDSNPRWDFSHTPLAGARLQPLGHLSEQRRAYYHVFLKGQGKTSIKLSD